MRLGITVMLCHFASFSSVDYRLQDEKAVEGPESRVEGRNNTSLRGRLSKPDDRTSGKTDRLTVLLFHIDEAQEHIILRLLKQVLDAFESDIAIDDLDWTPIGAMEILPPVSTGSPGGGDDVGA